MDAKPLPAWPTWCPQCGPHVLVDSDGTCRSCGADAMGEGADTALQALAELATLRARIAAAVAECERLERASGAEQCQTELPFRVAARRIRAKLEGR